MHIHPNLLCYGVKSIIETHFPSVNFSNTGLTVIMEMVPCEFNSKTLFLLQVFYLKIFTPGSMKFQVKKYHWQDAHFPSFTNETSIEISGTLHKVSMF
jgi:hypothetical protein